MTTVQKVLMGAGVVVVLGAIVTASVFSKKKETGTEVYLEKAAKGDLASSVSGTGRIEARTKVNIQSSVIGEIVGLPVKEGDTVRKGDLLVQIDPERYRSEVDRLVASLKLQRIALEQAELELADAQRTLRRQNDLWTNGGIVSRELLDRAELGEKSAQINVRSLTERIAQAGADLSKARDELSKTTIRSPIDGTVTQLNAEQGEITLTGTMNNPGTVIMIVSDMSAILAEVDVDETRVVKVEAGQISRISVDAVSDSKPHYGKVAEIAGSAVKRPGTDVQVFEVKIALDDVDARLKPGMTARARIETQKAVGAVTVPIQSVLLRSSKEVDQALSGEKDDAKDDKKGKEKTAGDAAAADLEPDAAPEPEGKREGDETVSAPSSLRQSRTGDEREVVFKVVDGKAKLVPVTTGVSDETNVVIVEGIVEGDTVVTGPYRALKSLKHDEKIKEKKEAGKKDVKDDESSESGVQIEVD